MLRSGALLHLRALSSNRSNRYRSAVGRGSCPICEKRRCLSTSRGGRSISEACRSRSSGRAALPTALNF